jgi:hypothetical protein
MVGGLLWSLVRHHSHRLRELALRATVWASALGLFGFASGWLLGGRMRSAVWTGGPLALVAAFAVVWVGAARAARSNDDQQREA